MDTLPLDFDDLLRSKVRLIGLDGLPEDTILGHHCISSYGKRKFYTAGLGFEVMRFGTAPCFCPQNTTTTSLSIRGMA